MVSRWFRQREIVGCKGGILPCCSLRGILHLHDWMCRVMKISGQGACDTQPSMPYRSRLGGSVEVMAASTWAWLRTRHLTAAKSHLIAAFQFPKSVLVRDQTQIGFCPGSFCSSEAPDKTQMRNQKWWHKCTGLPANLSALSRL